MARFTALLGPTPAARGFLILTAVYGAAILAGIIARVIA